jgi:acetyl-CoA carboxylase biotin carboxyl carrier protein
MTNVTPEDVQALIELFDAGNWDELHITLDDFQLHLNKDPAARRVWNGGERAVVDTPAASVATPAPVAAPAVSATADATRSADYQIPDGMSVLKAPNLGTFYRSPKPGAAPYVEIGQKVDADTDVCLIEVMKLFTPVKAGVAGTIREILVGDAELVEFDRPLFVIEPDA